MIIEEQVRKAWAAYYPKRRSEAELALICRHYAAYCEPHLRVIESMLNSH